MKSSFFVLVKILRYTLGVLLIIAGLLGTLIPIPFVPFFLIAVLGFYVLGKEDWIKKFLEKRKKQ